MRLHPRGMVGGAALSILALFFALGSSAYVWIHKDDEQEYAKKYGFGGRVAPFEVTAPSGGVASTTEFFGSVTPDRNNAYDLGSSVLSWRDIYASGTANLGGISLSGSGLSSASSHLTNLTWTNATGTNTTGTNMFISGTQQFGASSFLVASGTSKFRDIETGHLLVAGSSTFGSFGGFPTVMQVSQANENIWGQVFTSRSGSVPSNWGLYVNNAGTFVMAQVSTSLPYVSFFPEENSLGLQRGVYIGPNSASSVHLSPLANVTHDIGSESRIWRNLHASSSRLSELHITGSSTFGSFGGLSTPFRVVAPNDSVWTQVWSNREAQSNWVVFAANSGRLFFSQASTSQEYLILSPPEATVGHYVTSVILGANLDFIPELTNASDLGSGGLSFQDIFASGTQRIGTNLFVSHDVIFGSQSSSSPPFHFDTQSPTSSLAVGQGGTANVFVGSSTYGGGLNTQFSPNGDDLFVQGNIGSVSSVYSNGAFVAGSGSTFFGDGFITNTLGTITMSAIQIPSSTNAIRVGNGTDNNPAYSFVNDPTLGLHRPSAGVLEIDGLTQINFDIAGGATRIAFDSDQILPQPNNTIDFGSPTLSFKDVYTSGTARVGTDLFVTGASNLTGNVTIGGSLITASAPNFYAGLTVGNLLTATGTTNLRALTVGGALTATSTVSLNNGATIGGTLSVTGTTIIPNLGSNIIPTANNTLDLGHATTSYRNIYASSTIIVGVSSTASNVGVQATGVTSTFLTVFGRSQLQRVFTQLSIAGGGNLVCINQSTGEIRDSNSTTACAASARKFKKDIVPSDVGLSTILQLQPITFTRKQPFNDANDHRRFLSLIADDVELVEPMLVDHSSNSGEVQTLDTFGFIGAFVNSIQELYGKIVGIDARVRQLERENHDLKLRLDRMERQLNQ